MIRRKVAPTKDITLDETSFRRRIDSENASLVVRRGIKVGVEGEGFLIEFRNLKTKPLD